MNKQIRIDINDEACVWHKKLVNADPLDYLIFCEDRSKLLWFFTNYVQYVTVIGNSEICVLHGKSMETLNDVIYQLNNTLPVGYEVAYSMDALYDLLLNFETEPQNRYIFWQDSDYLFNINYEIFSSVFERTIVSAFCNRNGIGTIKEDGARYTVNQRNFFVFNSLKEYNLSSIIDCPYYIPSIEEDDIHSKFHFNLVEIY